MLQEQKLSSTGLIDPTSVRELGRILGVDAIVSGTISDLGISMKVNARIISTETGTVFAAASANITKDERVETLLGKDQKQKEQKLRKMKEFVNLAKIAEVTASSAYSAEFIANNVKDGIKGNNGTGEWASKGQGPGAWVQLSWSSEVEVSKIILYDRPNENDQVQQATISFSDGSELEIGSLPNDGRSPSVLTLTPYKEITWLRFTVVSSHGPNIGLSEIEVIGR